MIKRKNVFRNLIALGVVCMSMNMGAMSANALEMVYPPTRTVNDYNVYKLPDNTTKSSVNNNQKNLEKNTNKTIEDYIIPSSAKVKTVESYIVDKYEDVLTKSTNDLLTNKEYKDTYTVSEDGKVTLENNKEITKKLLNTNYTIGQKLNPEYIIIHDTGNRSAGADTMAHYNYWTSGNSEKTSAHYVVDDETVMQLLEHDQVGWHTGVLFTKNPKVPQAVNKNSIGIELCVNEDGDFMETMKNGIALTKYLMDEFDIPAERVITHNDATGKICPAMMIQDNPSLWKLFKAEISNTEEETKIADTLAMP